MFFMKKGIRSWKSWELAGVMALCVCFCTGLWAQRTQSALSDGLVRLHIVANSDRPDDQAAKLRLRDEILDILTPALEGAESRGEAVEILEGLLPRIEALGDLRVSLTEERFPTRDYTDFSLPAGHYLALRVVMGEGQGHNWWCVLYPPLCTEALVRQSQETFASLSEEEKALVTRSDEGYVLKFRIVELWEQLVQAVEGQEEKVASPE